MRAVAYVAILLAFTAPLHADERTDIVARIDDAVHAIATALDGDPDLDAARKHSSEVRELVTRLASVGGSHPRANEILAHYKGYADAFDAAAAVIARMRKASHSADGVLARCIKADAELSASIDKVKAHPDPDPSRDLARLSASGDAYGTSWTSTLGELAGVDRAIAADVTASHLSLTDSYWMSVSSHVDVAVHAIASAWTERYEPVTAGCAQLGLGQRHPELAPVLDELRKQAAATRSSTKQLTDDYNAWLRSVRGLRDLALKARDDIRGAICGATDLDLESRVENVADAAARELADDVTRTTGEATALRTRADSAKIKSIVDGLKSTAPTIASVERAESRGRQSPRLHAVLAATKRRRDDTVRLQGCTYGNIELAAVDCAAGSCRITCIKVAPHACKVVEVVPDNDHATADGAATGDRDIRDLRAWYAHDHTGLFARYPALRRCETDDKVELELAVAVTTYPACAKLTAADLGDTLAEVPPDLH